MNSYADQQQPPLIWDKIVALRMARLSGPYRGPSSQPTVGPNLYNEPPRGTLGPPYSEQGLTDVFELSGYTRRSFEYPEQSVFYIGLSSDEYVEQGIGYYTQTFHMPHQNFSLPPMAPQGHIWYNFTHT